MENQVTRIPDADKQVNEDDISLMDLLLVIAKYNRFIIKITIVVAVLAVGASLLVANSYTAKAVIMPPQQGGSSASMLLGQLGGLAGAVGGGLGLKNPNDLYVGMMKSRTVSDALIDRFKLMTIYDVDTRQGAQKELDESAVIVSGKEGFITIEFSDKDPKLAAAVANAYVEELDKLSKTLAVTEASQRRLFFEKQLKQVKLDLSEAEIALKQTQEQTGLIQPDKQGGAIIEAVAKLRAEIAAKEVELAAMRTYATEQNPDYLRLSQVVSSLRAQLAGVERTNVAGNGDVMVPTGKVPAAGLQYLRKMREVKYQETLFELLSKQFEMAKIDEAKNAALIQVIDKALPPEKKSKPKRAIIVVLATLMAFFVGVLLAFFKEATERSRQNPEQAARMNLLFRYLRQGR